MTQQPADRQTDVPLSPLFESLASAARRRILGVARSHSPATVAESDLATIVAARALEKPIIEVESTEHDRTLTRLRHVHLPLLADAGLIERDGREISATSHPAYRDEGVRDAIAPRDDADGDDRDALFGALSDRRRRAILAVLADQRHPISVETLARDVAAETLECTEREVPDAELERVHVSLVHKHLPALRDAGLIEHEGDAVTYEGHPDLRARWLRSELGDASTDSARSTGDDAPSDGVEALEGREDIVTRGQSLCERADEELFMMVTTTGLLEEGCFARIEDALDRGVDVYLGSRDRAVRDAVRERAPEVVLWEPQTDWLNLPPDRDSIGRLVFADREAVMVGTIGERGGDGFQETAIYGEGVDNGLVVLMRQMLGSRLDHLDAQSEDVLSQLPF